ncbi:ThuA domain-containing protein [Plantibacter sp. RU18]|uniref:ThuA domain-containing protein n=1 Tax=Plantibacter sp. RU18 TaxID=3158143 RepID=UPI003D3615CD
MKTLIASGSGRYADPWHPYDRTSPLIAEVLSTAGFETTIDDDVDQAMTRLDGVDLLIVNAGDPWRSDQPGDAPCAAIDGLAAALERGVGVIAFHAALASLRDYPEWAPAIGAVWLPGVSWHPPSGRTVIRGLRFPDGAPVHDLEVDDEQYLRLQRLGPSGVVAEHEIDGERFPAAWVREHEASRVAVDALGHDERSYESAGHRALIAQLAQWVTEPRGAA